MANNLPWSSLRSLYNTPVQSAAWVTRPKEGTPGWVPSMYPTTHSGVKVTLVNRQEFLIHKGPGFGKASETVVTDAAHMSSKWQVKESRDLGGSRTVGDFVKTGGEKYDLWRGNCHDAAKSMMNQGKN